MEGVIEDDNYLPIIYTLDEKDDWRNPSVWAKANPCLGITLREDFLKKFCLDAQQIPQQESEFRTKCCAQWLSDTSAWISAKAWSKCNENALTYSVDKSRPYFAVCSIDLSKRIDLTALTLVIYQDGKYFLQHKLYFPKESLAQRIKKENELWGKWVETGYVIATEGSTINYEYLFNDIKKWGEEYDISEVLFDPYNSCSLINELEQEFNLVEITQNIKNLSPMSKSFEEEVLKGNVVCNHPVMRWAVSNATIYQDPNGNIKVQKIDEHKQNRRIDCVITSLMGVGRIRSLLDNDEIDLRTKEQVASQTSSFLNSLSWN